MLKRDLSQVFDRYIKFPAIALLGPRQSGKTTLARQAFPRHAFVTFDSFEDRSFAQAEPERFLQSHENEHGIIIDEFQYVPNLLPAIKMAIDSKRRPGYFILTGSQNYLANKEITESLAGRMGILNLLPFSMNELAANKLLPANVNDLILNGFYPRIYFDQIAPNDLYRSYVQSYLERDVRDLINVGNLSTFQKFMALCAGRIGQTLNIDALGAECGVTFGTARSWLSILEANYVIFLLQPYYESFNKRVVRRPKLYFFDTGLACSLLRISNIETLSFSPFRGALFESLIIADLYKQYCNMAETPPLYFWQDVGGKHEVDCVVNEHLRLFGIEIKSGQTIAADFFKGLEYWHKLTGDSSSSYLIYGGNAKQDRSIGSVRGWNHCYDLVSEIRAKAMVPRVVSE